MRGTGSEGFFAKGRTKDAPFTGILNGDFHSNDLQII
jgi:hypothetical protein